jgi:queuine tRNA-ribosyltransferase subunit QTRTD1
MAVPLADLTNSASTPTSKRAIRMADRTEDWLAQWFSSSQPTEAGTAIFAPTLPIPYALQWEYLTRLSSDFASSISGLAVYSVDIIPDLSNHPELSSKPRLSLDAPATPHHILRQVALGVDIFLLPFLNGISDSGVALTFQFPPPSPAANDTGSGTSLLPLGKDLSDPSFASSVNPLREGCRCYTCTTHHAAYVHHLLSAREMLGWSLLQIHNHFTLSSFFDGIRTSLSSGGTTFAEDSNKFQTAYEAEVPAGTGERPRARGYHFKSEAGEGKRNKKAWDAKLGGADGETGGVEGGEVEGLKIGEVEKRLERDLTETPVVPDGDAGELERGGFAEVNESEGRK